MEEVAVTTEQPVAEVAETKSGATKAKARRRGKELRQVRHGSAHIQASYNNTIVTLADLNGNVLSWSSAGRVGFRGPKKSTPYAAGVIVKDACDRAKGYGLQEVNVFVKGVGSGREAAIRALHANGIQVMVIKDITPIPHNGCRPPRPRRV